MKGVVYGLLFMLIAVAGLAVVTVIAKTTIWHLFIIATAILLLIMGAQMITKKK